MGIRARNFDYSSALGSQDAMHFHAAVTLTGTGTNSLGIFPYSQRSPPFGGTATQSQFARIVDVVAGQSQAGVGGTSYTYDIQKNGVSILSTLGGFTLAGGASIATDAKGELTAPTGATRPVLKKDSTILIKKGDIFTVVFTVTGTYTTAAQLTLTLVVDPDPV